MSEQKYTPGPWKVGYASPENIETSTLAVWQDRDLEAGFGSVICKVSPEKSMNDTDKANAQLIASAPELLEALKLCYTALMLDKMLSGKAKCCQRAMEEAERAIRQATETAKATIANLSE